MDIVITAVLIGLFFIIVIWVIVTISRSKDSLEPPITPMSSGQTGGNDLSGQTGGNDLSGQTGGNDLSGKTTPVNNSAPAPSDKLLINTYFNVFVYNLFAVADGKKVDMEDTIKNLVSVLCLSDTHKVKDTLTEYVNELRVLMETYKEGLSVSKWVSDSSSKSVTCGTCGTSSTSGTCGTCGTSSSSSSSDPQSVSNADQIEQIRYLSSKLNSEFEGCVRFNGGHFGILFGILATNIISYKQNLNKGKVDQALIIRRRVMDYIEKVN